MEENNNFSGMRIAKAIARAGLCSRREAERWIMQGRVKVDGHTLSSPAFVISDQNVIKVDDTPIESQKETKLWCFHKPRGSLVTRSDPQHRKTIFDILPKELNNLIAVGRLDFNSEGLLLLTNNGQLSRHFELPSNRWSRHYRVRAFGNISKDKIKKLERGITIDGIHYAPAVITIERSINHNTWLSIVLTEGKNREIRKMLAYADLQVNRLIRISFGPFTLDKLPIGKVKEVSKNEVTKLLTHFNSKT